MQNKKLKHFCKCFANVLFYMQPRSNSYVVVVVIFFVIIIKIQKYLSNVEKNYDAKKCKLRRYIQIAHNMTSMNSELTCWVWSVCECLDGQCQQVPYLHASVGLNTRCNRCCNLSLRRSPHSLQRLRKFEPVMNTEIVGLYISIYDACD